MAKATKEETIIEPTKVVEVKEAPANVVELKNPYLTVRVIIEGLAPYERTGLQAKVLKTIRAWIRQRGLTVQMEGVKMEEFSEAGAVVPTDNGDVTADLRVYTFSEECVTSSGRKVTIPSQRELTAKRSDASATEVTPVVGAEVTPATGAEDTGDAETQPSDW